jgi:hypothetical protein
LGECTQIAISIEAITDAFSLYIHSGRLFGTEQESRNLYSLRSGAFDSCRIQF